MALTVELPSFVEEEISRAARQQGKTAEEYAATIIVRNYNRPRVQGRPLRGFLTGAPGSVDEFLAEKHAETVREDPEA